MARFVILVSILIIPALGKAMSVTNLSGNGLKATVFFISQSENHSFSIIDVPTKKAEDSILSYWDPEKHNIMINGSFFNADFTSTGLYRLNSQYIQPKQSKGFSGFVGIDPNGKVHILSKHDKLDQFPTLLQSGPFVIDPGGKMGIRSKTGRKARRTLIGIMNTEELVIIVTEPIYLLDLAKIIHKLYPSMDRLLNLDGGPSTALMSEQHRVVNIFPVRNYLVQQKTN